MGYTSKESCGVIVSHRFVSILVVRLVVTVGVSHLLSKTVHLNLTQEGLYTDESCSALSGSGRGLIVLQKSWRVDSASKGSCCGQQ